MRIDAIHNYLNNKSFKLLLIFATLLVFIFLLQKQAFAETSPYRSAGWVATDGNPAYSSIAGCQVSNDGLYCSRSIGGSFGNLYFGSFGQLEEFGIPINSKIDKLHLRITGKSSSTQYVGVVGAYNKIPFNSSCQTPYDLWTIFLGSAGTTIEKHTSTSGNGLAGCITANNINFRNLTMGVGNYLTAVWSADIDNFEIAFDYTPPIVTRAPVIFPENQKGAVWEIGPDKTNISQVELASNVVAIAVGDTFNVVLKNDGSVWTWTNSDKIPKQVRGENGVGFLTDVKKITAGMLLKNDGTVWTFGQGLDGSLSPVKINLADVVDITMGDGHMLALKSNGTVYGWGKNNQGQVGIGCTGGNCSTISSPRLINNFIDVVQIAAGGNHSYAVKNDGTVWGWGRTSSWELAESGQDSFGRKLSPVQITEFSDIIAVFSKVRYNFALSNSGEVFEWGQEKTKPQKIQGLGNVKTISAAWPVFSPGVTGHAIKEDGTLWQLYINDIPPKQVPHLKDVVAVASGDQTPALAVINSTGDVLGDSTVAPFLDLPWDYGGAENFEKQVFNPESWFDHEFPLQNIFCCTQKVRTYDGLEKSVPYRSHAGYDYASKNGVEHYTPVLAAADGIAEHKSASNSGGLGDMIKINHRNGYQTWYGHLDPIDLIVGKEGETKDVKRGDIIGKTGFTGNIVPQNEFGAHIHFGVFKDANGNGSFADDYPVGLVDPLGWEGKEKDPWTEHEHNNRFGSLSVNLFSNFPKPKQQFIPKSGGALIHKNVKVKFDPGTLPLDFTLHYKDGPYEYFSEDDRDFNSVAPSFFLEVVNSIGDQITHFLKPVIIIYDYKDVDLSNTKEESLKLHYYDILQQKWIPIDSVPDLENKLIIAEVEHFTQFAVMGEVKDSVAPSTRTTLDGVGGEDGWYSSSVDLKLAASDNENGIGVEKTLYSLNDEIWKTYSENLIVSIEEEHKISFQSSDKAGNVEDAKEVIFQIDKTFPATTATVSGTEGDEGWFISDVNVKLTANDSASGISKIEYSLNDGETYKGYEEEILVSKEGTSEMLYRSIDKAGNVEDGKILALKIDKTAPSTVVYASGLRGEDYWYRSNVTVALDGNDNVSGYKTSYYSVDNGENYIEYIDPITLKAEGEHKILYYSIDIAGNIEEKKDIEIRIDKTSPVVSINANPSHLWPANGKMVDLRISGSVDEENPLDTNFIIKDEYGLIEPILSNFNQTIKLQAKRNGNDLDGRAYKIEAMSSDLAGNRGDASVEVIVPHDLRN